MNLFEKNKAIEILFVHAQKTSISIKLVSLLFFIRWFEKQSKASLKSLIEKVEQRGQHILRSMTYPG